MGLESRMTTLIYQSMKYQLHMVHWVSGHVWLNHADWGFAVASTARWIAVCQASEITVPVGILGVLAAGGFHQPAESSLLSSRLSMGCPMTSYVYGWFMVCKCAWWNNMEHESINEWWKMGQSWHSPALRPQSARFHRQIVGDSYTGIAQSFKDPLGIRKAFSLFPKLRNIMNLFWTVCGVNITLSILGLAELWSCTESKIVEAPWWFQNNA